MQTITMAYPEERKPIALSHTFTGENDAVSLRALLKGNGIETKAFDSYTVTDGDASAMELVDQDDDLLIAQIAAFDRAVLSVVTVDRQQITLTLYGWKADESPAQEQPQAEPGKITLESTDGETYLVRVTYENDAGLPMGSTALYVKPIRESELRFGAYLNAAAKTLGLKTKDIELSRVFDIKIVDANNPKMVFEPKGEVEVSITLLDTDLCQYGKVSVLHFVENAHSGDVAVDKRVNTVEGETVSFTTDGFSVYVIVGDETPRRTYYFYTLDEYLDYTEYILYTDEGESTTTQTIKNGETVVVPANPVNPQDPDATFAGWYKGGSDPTHPNMEANPYDFDNIPAVTQSEVVCLYAQFKSYAYVVFHGQYDSTSETYPVAITRRAELINGSAEVNISDCSVAYTGAGNSYVFSAWAKEPVREPNGTMSEYGSPVAIITVEPDASGNITITKTTHLYPLYTPVYWLSFYSGPIGSGATYYPETYYYNGVGPTMLNNRIPTRDPETDSNDVILHTYVFTGWYADAALDSVSGEASTASPAVKIANADGSLVGGASATGVSVNAAGTEMTLTDNVTLYAGWEYATTANYTVVIVKQKASDPADSDETNNTYEFSESITLTGSIGATVNDAAYRTLDVDADYNSIHGTNVSGAGNPYNGYTYSSINSDGSKTVVADGSTVLYVRYNYVSQPSAPTGSYNLIFADSNTVNPSDNLPVEYNSIEAFAPIPYGNSLAQYVPDDPVSGIPQGYEFNGWYADAACTTRAFFTDNSEYQNYAGSRALFETMPAADITFYAGWKTKWYIVKIDPNYGAMYQYEDENGTQVLKGTGSTWFWGEYGEKIQEYTTTKREYAESESGTYYYVNHDYAWSGGSGPERKTYYTENPSEATEFTTFEYDPNVYRYEGWYEVKQDGTEEPYDFNRIIEGEITIKLHWVKNGVFYLEYNPGEGTLYHEDENEKLYLELDGDTYADDADVQVTRTAIAPDGYEFVGWTIRGDETEKIYRPGQTFRLLSKYTAMVQGKRKLYLDAVYTRVETANIVYHANGGTLTDPGRSNYRTYFGGPATIDGTYTTGYTLVTEGADPRVTVSNLANNATVILATGQGFALTGATFVGWCANEVYDPADTSAPLLLPNPGESITYGVDTQDPVDLYAVWQVPVTYHLNETTANANFGSSAWGEGYTLDPSDTYTQNVYRGSTLSYPPQTPQYANSSKVFLYWATEDNGVYTQYTFSDAVTGPLELYAVWGTPPTVTVHAVNATAETIVLSDSWLTSTSLSVPATTAATKVLFSNIKPDPSTSSTTYTYEFATVHVNVTGNSDPNLQTITKNPAEGIYYNPQDGTFYVCYQNGDEVSLADGEAIYFVYDQVQSLDITYTSMGTDGALTTNLVTLLNSDSQVPHTANDLGIYDMAANVTRPLYWREIIISIPSLSLNSYSYAIGSPNVGNSGSAADLTLITQSSDTDNDRPPLQIRNTWRGFEYSTDDGSTWTPAGYDIELYVVYYPYQATVVTFREETIGTAADMDLQFTFNYKIEECSYIDNINGWSSNWSTVYDSSTGGNPSILLKNDETYSAILFSSSAVVTGSIKQRITVTQTEMADFTTEIGDTATRVYTFEASNTSSTQNVTFTNIRETYPVTVHLAEVDVYTGDVLLQDGWRRSTTSLTLNRGATVNLRSTLPGATFIVSGHEDYGFGAIFSGKDTGTDGNELTQIRDMSGVTLSYEPIEPGSHIYGVYLKDGEGNTIAEFTADSDLHLYYLYYPLLTIYYMLEGDNGVLTPIKGWENNEESETITYGGQSIALNGGQTVVQGQKVEMSEDGLTISQTVGSGNFNMPPVLDYLDNEKYLVYVKLGAIPQADAADIQDNTSDFDDPSAQPEKGISEDLILYMKIVDNKLQWRFTHEEWTEIDKYPVVYAIYRERGYELEITKDVPIDTGYREPFTITVSSTAINRTKYTVEGTGYTEITATPAANGNPGTLSFEVMDNSVITVYGLASGEYTVTESGNTNYILTLEQQIGSNQATNPEPVNSGTTLTLDDNAKLKFTNTPKVICRINTEYFYTLSDAITYIDKFATNFTETIYMLVDYEVPSSDSPEILSYMHVTLSTDSGYVGEGSGTAILTRKDTNTNGPLFTNHGEFTLGNITIDGDNVTTAEALIDNSGTLNIETGSTMQNAKGGAVNSWDGSVNLNGGTVSDNTAAKGGAIYASGGDVNISSGTLSDNSATRGGAIYNAGTGTVTVNSGTISGNSAQSGGAIYMENGVVYFKDGTITANTASVSGGAIFAQNAYVNMHGGTISNNTASVNGGAINIETLTFAMTAGTISGNSAGNGGGVWSGTGAVELSGTSSISGNTATGSGGGVYSASSTFSMTDTATITGNTAAVDGGGVCSNSGSVTLGSGTNITNNTATAGNGGGICSFSGAVTITSATLSSNKAPAGNGGALWTDTGASTLNSVTMQNNEAINGAAAFANNSSMSFVGGTIGHKTSADSANKASNGGEVGVGNIESRLYFSGGAVVYNNTLSGTTLASNVYLNYDSDTILHFNNLSNNAKIGIYVPGTVSSDLYQHRSVPSARFGTYDSTNYQDHIYNDRTPMQVEKDTDSSKLYWVRTLNIAIYYVSSFNGQNAGLPFIHNPNDGDFPSGSEYVTTVVETPSSANASIAVLAEDIRSTTLQSYARYRNAVFGYAFSSEIPDGGTAHTPQPFEKYITNVLWDITTASNGTETGKWKLQKHDGTDRLVTYDSGSSAPVDIIMFFTEPYYMNIENNSDTKLTIDPFVLNGSSGVKDVVRDGYGYTFAINDAVQTILLPVTASDLVLYPGESICILIPGGKNLAYTVNGHFDPDELGNYEPVDYTKDSAPGTVSAYDAEHGFTITGNTPNSSGQTHNLIFGGARAICRVVVNQRIQTANSDPQNPTYVSTGFVQENAGEGATAGKWEYTFASPNQARDFIFAHHTYFVSGMTATATIEMLKDYSITSAEKVVLTSGDGLIRDITFQTSVDGHYRYDPEHTTIGGPDDLVNPGTNPRATISRAANNYSSFIETKVEPAPSNADAIEDQLTLKNLIFDGVTHSGTIEKGVINTKDWNVSIDRCEFIDCKAKDGGGIAIDFTPNGLKSNGRGGTLTVTNTNFTNCKSDVQPDRNGGGAIWTYAKTLTVRNCNFTHCSGRDQGGAIFHRIDSKNRNSEPACTFATTSTTIIDNCHFTSCSARSGGAMELDSHHATITNSTFDDCRSIKDPGGSKTGSGGAIATYIWEKTSYVSYGDNNQTFSTDLTVRGCTFEHCSSVVGSNINPPTGGHGGAIRSHSMATTVEDCTFYDCNAEYSGGAIAVNNGITNGQAPTQVSTVINGCSFTDCNTSKWSGGAIYCNSLSLTIGSYTETANGVTTTRSTSFTNCKSHSDGGAVFHDRTGKVSAADLASSTFSMSDTTITGCEASANNFRTNAVKQDGHGGGGVYTTAPTVTMTNCTVDNCSTPKKGGGVYVNMESAGTVTLTDVEIGSCSAGDNGGGLCSVHGASTQSITSTLTIQKSASGIGSSIHDNTITAGKGGGVYTTAQVVELNQSTILTNTAISDGGGICHESSNSGTVLKLIGTADDPAEIKNNISSGKGGGAYESGSLTMQGTVTVTNNRLRTENDADAAGIWLNDTAASGDAVTVSVGTPTDDETTTVLNINGNLTQDGKKSDLRLPDGSSENKNSVDVYCGVSGEIRVVNARKKLTQFGEAVGCTNPVGFNDLEYVFSSDAEGEDLLYGIVDRSDTSGTRIIWGADPICKITDETGKLLYLDTNHARPAVFDRLDIGGSGTSDRSSAFGVLRASNTNLYYANGTPYNGSTYQVKMLVEHYTAEKYITTNYNSSDPGRTIILTTAGKNDSLYPYRGRAGSRSTILRDPLMNTGQPMITVNTNLTLTNICLDGGSENGVVPSGATRILKDEQANTTILLGKNATLENANITGNMGYGGGVRLHNGAALIIEGGSIRNCVAEQGGGGVQIKNGSLTFTAGTITLCEAGATGGGVYYEKGSFTMTGGIISRCEADKGGGVYIKPSSNASLEMGMEGGTITGNHAQTTGGGIAVENAYVKLKFKNAPYVYGNTVGDETQEIACNVQLDYGFNFKTNVTQSDNPGTVIVSQGLIRGATIGVYVPGTDNNVGVSTSGTLYDKHGGEADPFGTYSGSDAGLNYFINDRNGMKGGLMEGQASGNKKVYWRVIYGISVTKQVVSDDPFDAEKDYSFTVTLSGDSVSGGLTQGSAVPPGTNAVNINSSTADYGDMYFINGVANFRLKSGETITAEKLPLGFTYTVTENLSAEELAHFKISAEDHAGNISVQQTSVTGVMDDQSMYTYAVKFSNMSAICKICDPTYGLLYTVNENGDRVPAVYSNLALAFNRVNASEYKEWYYKEGEDYVLYDSSNDTFRIEMLISEYEMDYPTSLASLISGKHVTLTTAARNADDGFPYVGRGTAKIIRSVTGESMFTIYGDLTLDNIVLDGGSDDTFTCNDDGGIVLVKDGGELTIGTGITMQNSTTQAGKNGPAIYLEEGATLYISGDPHFDNNVTSTAVTGNNGGAAYPTATQKQDIYIAGYAGVDAESIVVTGNLTGSQGTIWVWAEENPHYTQSQQFALVNTNSSTGAEYTGLDVFRNAQTDVSTGNSPNPTDAIKYLYGVSHSDGKVYWSGSATLTVIKKVTGPSAELTRSFDFSVTGLTAGASYSYTRFTWDDSTSRFVQIAQNPAGTLVATANGEITFYLKHEERIDIAIPSSVTATVSENSAGYIASYKIDNAASVPGSSASNILMDADKQIVFTNERSMVSPSGISLRVLPFTLILGAGLGMVSILLAKRRRKDEEEAY